MLPKGALLTAADFWHREVMITRKSSNFGLFFENENKSNVQRVEFSRSFLYCLMNVSGMADRQKQVQVLSLL